MSHKVHLDHAHLVHLLRSMMRIRHFEAKCVELYQAQKILGFLHLYDGEEAVSVGVMEALQPQDAVIATYREHGQALARGVALPLALGVALGDKMQGRKAVTACFFGDGAADEGEFHETLNLAKLWRLPILFVCQQHLYEMGMA